MPYTPSAAHQAHRERLLCARGGVIACHHSRDRTAASNKAKNAARPAACQWPGRDGDAARCQEEARGERGRRGSAGARGGAPSPPVSLARTVARPPAQNPLRFSWFKPAKQGDAETLHQLAPTVDVNALGDEGDAALHAAVRSRSLAAVEVLLAAGASTSIATRPEHLQPLHVAAELADQEVAVPIIKALLAAGAAPDARDGDGGTPAHVATYYGNAEALTVLLDAGVPVDIGAGTQRGSPLYRACWSRSANAAQVVQLLLQRGAAANTPRPQPAGSALHRAVSSDEVAVVEVLLRAGAMVDARDEQGRTPLMCWGYSEDSALAGARLLLAAGAAPNAADNEGNTALHRAARETSNPPLVKFLAAWGADPLRTNKEGQRPLQLVPENVHPAYILSRLHTIAALVAAGDRDWALVPRPCPGLEGALGAVWRATPHELPQLVARLNWWALARVRTALLVLCLRTPLPQPLVMPVLARAFDY